MIIFDFDLTLVDTSSMELARKNGEWKRVMGALPKLPVYPGVHEMLSALHQGGETLAILTRSPDMVPKKAVQLHDWPIEIVLGYHDVTRRKPDPEGVLLAMKRGGAQPADTFHVGDNAEDTFASRGAGVIAVGAAWGTPNLEDLKASNPDHLLYEPEALVSLVFQRS